jgi:hypothetical protein
MSDDLSSVLPDIVARAITTRRDLHKFPELGMTEFRTASILGERLSGSRALLEQPLAIAGLPYGYVHAPDRRDPPGLFRLGDQAAVIASLTGDGVALALASGSLAARTWIAAGSSACYHPSLAAGLSPQMRVGSAIHRLCLAPGLQPWVAAACKLWPGAMRLAATATRARHLTSPASSGVG